MTADVTDYLSRVTAEHDDKPKFNAMLTLLAQWAVDRRNLLESIPALYDLDQALGEQLDVVGQWVGLSRNLPVPLDGVYFSFDTEGLGFDQGVWQGRFDPDEGISVLDDATYRTMLYLKIATNHWDGSFEDAQRLLTEWGAIGLTNETPTQWTSESTGGALDWINTAGDLVTWGNRGTTHVFLQDNFDMTMTLCLSGAIPNALLLALIRTGQLSLRPAAVGSNAVVTTVEGAPIFGFDTENAYISGFDGGAWARPL